MMLLDATSKNIWVPSKVVPLPTRVHLNLSHPKLQRSCVAGPDSERSGEQHATQFRQLMLLENIW
jgi:hypothetical protein